jgi:hypothetical protein
MESPEVELPRLKDRRGVDWLVFESVAIDIMQIQDKGKGLRTYK